MEAKLARMTPELNETMDERLARREAEFKKKEFEIESKL